MDASDYAEETSEADGLRAAIDASSGFDDWRAAFSDDFLRHAEARRTYDGTSVRALLRMLRNQSHHIRTSPFSELRTREGLLAFVLMRFPSLLLRVFEACHAALPLHADLRAYLGYFGAPALILPGGAGAGRGARRRRALRRGGGRGADSEREGPSGARTREAAEAPTGGADGGALAAREPRVRRGRPECAPRRWRSPTRRPRQRAAARRRSLPAGYRHAPLCKHWLASGGTHCPMTARGLRCSRTASANPAARGGSRRRPRRRSGGRGESRRRRGPPPQPRGGVDVEVCTPTIGTGNCNPLDGDTRSKRRLAAHALPR